MFSKRTNWDRGVNEVSTTLAKLRSSGTPILDLTKSNPTECGFAYDGIAILAAFQQNQSLVYKPHPLGLLAARSAVCRYYAEKHVGAEPEQVVLTSGTSEAYAFLFRLLCNTGDEVLIASPGYPLLDYLADLCDVKLVRFPLIYDHGWQLDFAALTAAVTSHSRAVIVVHPNNPTGHYTSAANQERLGKFCRERGLALIADEVFLDFSLEERLRQSSFAGGGNVLTFTLSGLSKICGLPQMKLAWITVSGPKREREEALGRLELIADAYLSVGTPVQLAAEALLQTRHGLQAQALTRMRANLHELDAQFARQSACARLAFEGGWSAVLRVPALQSDADLAVSLLTRECVSVHPGHFYDFAQPGHLVVSLIVPEAEFAEGIKQVLTHFSEI